MPSEPMPGEPEFQLGWALRDCRRLRRAVGRYRGQARRVEAASAKTVTRIGGEPIVGDLSERRFAELGLLMARERVAYDASFLAESIRWYLAATEQGGTG